MVITAMNAVRVFNRLNGWFYSLYGLYGVLLPDRMLNLMGWDASLLGLHQIRAVCMACCAIGLIVLLYSHKPEDQRPLLRNIIIVTSAFALGRLIGLWFDGVGPQQTYIEIGIETVWTAIGFFIYRHSQRVDRFR